MLLDLAVAVRMQGITTRLRIEDYKETLAGKEETRVGLKKNRRLRVQVVEESGSR